MSIRLFVLGAVLVGGFAAWRGAGFSSEAAAARRAESDLRGALAAQADIESLSRLPATAIAPTATDADILHEIQQTLSGAGLQAASVKDLTLSPPTAVPGQRVTRHAGRVSLERVPLEQVGRVLAAWHAKLRPYRIDRIDLNASPTGNESPAAVYRVAIGFSALSPAAEPTGAPR